MNDYCKTTKEAKTWIYELAELSKEVRAHSKINPELKAKLEAIKERTDNARNIRAQTYIKQAK